MDITLNLNDDQVESLTRFWHQQDRRETSPIDGSQVTVNAFADVTDLVVQHLQATLVRTAMELCPPASAKADMDAMQALKLKLADKIKLSVGKVIKK